MRSNAWKLVCGIMLVLPVLGLAGNRLYREVIFDRDCGDHIKRAGDANTVELAKEEMTTVVQYLETNQMTSGYTSVVYNTPDEEVGFWYKNLKSSLDELEKVRSETTQLEKSNLLLKLRQTLLDHKERGEKVTVPDGITVFPSNVAYFWILIVFLALLVPAVFFVASYMNEKGY